MAINLNDIANALKKKYGSVSLLKDSSDTVGYEKCVSTGNLSFDLILDGGIPFGHMTEFLGLSQSGKSLFCQMILSNAQKKYNATGIYVDRENALSEKRADQLGINTENVIIVPAKDVQLVYDAFNFIIQSIDLIRQQDTDQYIVVVVDSIGAFDKDAELDKADMGKKQKAISESLRRLLGKMDNRIAVLIVNQFYFSPGVMFGDPKKESSGEALKYFNSLKIGLTDKRQIVDADRNNEVIGAWIEAEVRKTRKGPCYRSVTLPFYYDGGIPYYGGYGRLLCHRNYMIPKNKQEFKNFKNSLMLYLDKDGKKEVVDELNMEGFLEKHPDLIFDSYPAWNELAEEPNL